MLHSKIISVKTIRYKTLPYKTLRYKTLRCKTLRYKTLHINETVYQIKCYTTEKSTKLYFWSVFLQEYPNNINKSFAAFYDSAFSDSYSGR